MSELTWRGNWKVIKGRLKQIFGELTDNDLQYAEGQEEELIGRLQAKLGKTRDEIQKELDRADCGL